MDKKELITKCRYYSGETENSFRVGSVERKIWYYEKMWIERMSQNRTEFLANIIPNYISSGLENWEDSDGTPYELKAFLFNRYLHWLGGYGKELDVSNFKEWYVKNYIGQS